MRYVQILACFYMMYLSVMNSTFCMHCYAIGLLVPFTFSYDYGIIYLLCLYD